MGASVVRWWRQPDQFDWLTGYLRARGLAVPTKILMTCLTATLTLVGLAAVAMPGIPVVTLAVFCAVAVVIGFGLAVVWLTRWPTRRQSLVMAWAAAGLLAVGCLLQPQPLVALIVCTGIAIPAGYAAFFHNTKAIAVVVSVAFAAGVLCAFRAAGTYGWGIAAPTLFLVIELNVAVPVAIQAVVRALGTDVVRSDQDPLTGVLNRRAFYERATTLLTSPGHDLHLIVVMIDLDKFKKLNDAYGHLAGDQALTAVGWALREISSGSAIIGRFGGEEFIVIDALSAELAEQMPTELCAAIAALPQPVTASVGAAIVRWGSEPAMEDLIQSADAAMYAAKRAGGNQTRICRPDRVDL
jgi:diguanylate cyclase (GGDEF)-like protein